MSLLFMLTLMPRLAPRISPPSSSSSIDSLVLFPRPLTFCRTMSSQSPLVSPTPLGRYIQNASSLNVSSRSKFTNLRPVTRGKAPNSRRHTRISTAFHPPSKLSVETPNEAKSNYNSFERISFMDRLGLARVGGNRRRSSIASLSTLKIPRSFRHGPSSSQAGSSIYSRNTKDMSAVASPGFASEFSTLLQSLPERNPLRQTASFDETIFKDLDWTPPLDDDIDDESQHDGSAPLRLRETTVHGVNKTIPQTPTIPRSQRTAETETPGVCTASSTTSGTRMLIPKISIARSSDDVFGAGSSSTDQKHDVVMEPGLGRGFESVRAMGSKLRRIWLGMVAGLPRGV